MNSYSWVQPTTSSSLTLQREGKTLTQITKDGGLVSPFAMFTSLPEDANFEGNILVVDGNGLVRKANISLAKVSEEINTYFKDINAEIKKTLQEVQKEDEKAMNKVIADVNVALTTIQNNNKHEISQTSKSTDSRLARITMLERMTWIMFVLNILLVVAVIRLFVK
jgi:hypothetical protein